MFTKLARNALIAAAVTASAVAASAVAAAAAPAMAWGAGGPVSSYDEKATGSGYYNYAPGAYYDYAPGGVSQHPAHRVRHHG